MTGIRASSRKDLLPDAAKQHRRAGRRSVGAVAPAATFETLDTPDGEVAFRLEPVPAAERTRRAAGSAGVVNGIVGSPKNGRPMAYPNRYVGRLMVLLEVSPDVLSYETFPERVLFSLGGEEHRHVPALRVHRRDGSTAVVDIGYGVAPPDGGPKARVLTAIYARRGWRYQRIPKAAVSVEPRLGNAAEILAHAHFTPPPGTERAVVGALTGRGWRVIREVEADLPSEPYTRATLLALALRGDVQADLAAPEIAAMRVRLEFWSVRR